MSLSTMSSTLKALNCFGLRSARHPTGSLLTFDNDMLLAEWSAKSEGRSVLPTQFVQVSTPLINPVAT